MKKALLLIVTHAVVGAAGFAAGIYALPILTAPEPPPVAEVARLADQARFTGEFRRDLAGSDALHWGEGTVSVADDAVSLMGKIAPGPDYRLYLAPDFAEDEASFEAIKAQSIQVGEVKVFENFIVPVSDDVDVAAFNTVVVWCESFGEFISAAQYR
jgi:hypothetical protein